MPSTISEAKKMDFLLKRATEFHGHLGPFLVLGLRMGLAGLRELNIRSGEKKLQVTVKLPYSIPFSCAVDGLQIATKCTIGNKRLRIMADSGIEAKFELESGEQKALSVNTNFLEMLKGELALENVPGEKVRKLAHLVASKSDIELFAINRE